MVTLLNKINSRQGEIKYMTLVKQRDWKFFLFVYLSKKWTMNSTYCREPKMVFFQCRLTGRAIGD